MMKLYSDTSLKLNTNYLTDTHKKPSFWLALKRGLLFEIKVFLMALQKIGLDYIYLFSANLPSAINL